MKVSITILMFFFLFSCKKESSFVKYNFTEYEFKDAKYDTGFIETKLVIENVSDNEFILDTIVLQCGCTETVANFSTIPANKKDSITIKYNSDFPGFFNKDIIIYSNNSSSPDIINIKGNVKL